MNVTMRSFSSQKPQKQARYGVEPNRRMCSNHKGDTLSWEHHFQAGNSDFVPLASFVHLRPFLTLLGETPRMQIADWKST